MFAACMCDKMHTFELEWRMQALLYIPKSAIISAMPVRKSLPEAVGQLLIMGFDGTALTDSVRAMLRDMQPGGVILFARNIETPHQTHTLLRDIQKQLSARPFLCIDMEGGTVDRLKNAIAPTASPQEIASSASRELFREHGCAIGAEVCSLGFNVDFAPVLDLRFDASLSVLGSRTISPDPKAATLYAREFLRGLKESHVLGCGKHFPGLGEGSLDSHQAMPVVHKSFKRLWEEDLLPYRTLARQLPFVMVGHIAYPEVTGDQMPASLSRKWITDILRKRIGYKGLITTDDLEMGGVLAALPIEQTAVESLRAGGDIYLVCHKEERVRACYEAVLREAEKNSRFRQHLLDSAARVRRVKQRAPELSRRFPAPPTDAAIDKLRQRLWLLGEEARMAADAIASEA
jgi:beta-N-acetylhexosaminidase